MVLVWTECDYCGTPCEWTICAACECVLRDALVKARTAAPPTTPAPAWECVRTGGYRVRVGPGSVFVDGCGAGELPWRSAAYLNGLIVASCVGPYPTASEAAREAVAALRAIVGPVAAALDNVPDLDGDAP